MVCVRTVMVPVNTHLHACDMESVTATIILAEKQNEHRNPFQKWPRHGVVDNCIICWFNWKYKTLCTHHCRQLLYTCWQLMHRGTSQTCRGIWASFEHHSTFRNLIGFKQLIKSVTKITFSRMAYFIFYWIFFSTCGHFPPSTKHVAAIPLLLLFLFAFNFFHSVHLLYSSDLVLCRLCDYINTIFHLAVGELARQSTWKKELQAARASPYSAAAECNALSINQWSVRCFHNGVMKARSGS